MTVEEILQGESKDLEFKEKLPEDSKKYMKTIVAFSNLEHCLLLLRKICQYNRKSQML